MASNLDISRQRSPSEGGSTAWPLGRTAVEIALLSLILSLCYLSNRREIGVGDTEAVKMTCMSILQGDGLNLERYRPILNYMRGEEELPYFVARHGNSILSRYPIGPVILALPGFALQKGYLDATQPDWDRDSIREWRYAGWMAKKVTVMETVATAIAIYLLLLTLGLGAWSFWATLAVGLGSTLWMVSSQALWQHGPVALLLTIALWMLAGRRRSRTRFMIAGFAIGALPWMRMPAVLLALPLILWAIGMERRRALPMIIPCVVMWNALLWYHTMMFGHPLGGTAELESPRMHAMMHGIDSAWALSPWEGLWGTLISPSRGLAVFMPWSLLALAWLPRSLGVLHQRSLVVVATLSLLPFLAMLSYYRIWWGGYCFGPRYWTDAIPILAMSLGASFAWLGHQKKWFATGILATSVAFAISLQAIGAIYYPSDWYTNPTMVDRDHARLWDWRDSEITRCLHSQPHPPFDPGGEP